MIRRGHCAVVEIGTWDAFTLEGECYVVVEGIVDVGMLVGIGDAIANFEGSGSCSYYF